MQGTRRQLMKTKGLAEYTGIPVQTIYQWSVKGYGPKGMRVGRHVLYDVADVDAWLDALKEGDK